MNDQKDKRITTPLEVDVAVLKERSTSMHNAITSLDNRIGKVEEDVKSMRLELAKLSLHQTYYAAALGVLMLAMRFVPFANLLK